MSDTWTIGELAERAAEALQALRDGGAPAGAPVTGRVIGRVSGRVRDVPGERLIRWYTTIGLVDPPLARRGRVALYGRRHLLQLVAVKRLQAAGRSIAEIQAALAGAPDAALEAAARLTDPPAPPPSGREAPPVPAPAARTGPDGASPGRFWTRRPTGPGAENGAGRQGGPVPGDGGRAVSGNGGLPREGLVFGVRLGDGVRLVLDAARAPSEEDVQAVLAAAGPLLAVLEERGLT